MLGDIVVVSRTNCRRGNVGGCPAVEKVDTWLKDEEEEEEERVGAREVEGRKRLQQSAGSKQRFSSTSDSYARHSKGKILVRDETFAYLGGRKELMKAPQPSSDSADADGKLSKFRHAGIYNRV
jgi:hypothetical protein